MFFSRKVTVLLVAIAVIAVVAAIVAVCLTFEPDVSGDEQGATFKSAAITSNGMECAVIGRDTLVKGGSIADAAIATLFCEGVACAQSAGLGGGFLLTMYTKADGKITVLDSRERAPAAAHKDMFEGGNISSTTGGLAAAVPGELRGYETLYKRFGKLPWADLIQPTINLCKEGFYVSAYFAKILADRVDRIKAVPSLSEIFIDPKTNTVWVEGDKVKRLKLAESLEVIAIEGADALYNGTLTQNFLKDIHSNNGIITAEDMNNYQSTWREPVSIDIGSNMTLHTVPLPGTGHILAFILNTLRGWAVSTKDNIVENSLEYWQRIVEVFKYAYAKRTGLGDADYLDPSIITPLLANLTSMEFSKYIQSLIYDNKTSNNYTEYGAEFDIVEDHGTAHISIVAPNGDVIAVTSTINYILGAFFASPSTGIILNNEMDDFSYPNISNVYGLPPSPSNFPKPGKRPLSSMVPTIIIQEGKGARMVVGGAGGTKITTQVALIILKHLFNGMPLETAMDVPRLHHQLFPMEVQHEEGFDKDIIEGLKKIGHKTNQLASTSGFAAVTAITIDPATGILNPRYDKRRKGSVAGI